MTNNQPFDNQLQMFGQMAKRNGISGAAYIDVDPASWSKLLPTSSTTTITAVTTRHSAT